MFTDMKSFHRPIRVTSISICEVNLPVNKDIIYFSSFYNSKLPVATDKVDSE